MEGRSKGGHKEKSGARSARIIGKRKQVEDDSKHAGVCEESR